MSAQSFLYDGVYISLGEVTRTSRRNIVNSVSLHGYNIHIFRAKVRQLNTGFQASNFELPQVSYDYSRVSYVIVS